MELRKIVGQFLTSLGQDTWRLKDEPGGRFAYVPKEWQEEHPERFQQAVNSLHEQADKVVSIHRELVRLGRQYLKC